MTPSKFRICANDQGQIELWYGNDTIPLLTGTHTECVNLKYDLIGLATDIEVIQPPRIRCGKCLHYVAGYRDEGTCRLIETNRDKIREAITDPDSELYDDLDTPDVFATGTYCANFKSLTED